MLERIRRMTSHVTQPVLRLYWEKQPRTMPQRLRYGAELWAAISILITLIGCLFFCIDWSHEKMELLGSSVLVAVKFPFTLNIAQSIVLGSLMLSLTVVPLKRTVSYSGDDFRFSGVHVLLGLYGVILAGWIVIQVLTFIIWLCTFIAKPVLIVYALLLSPVGLTIYAVLSVALVATLAITRSLPRTGEIDLSAEPDAVQIVDTSGDGHESGGGSGSGEIDEVEHDDEP